MAINDFRELVAWQLVDELRREIIAFTDKEPACRDFKFRDQIRDAIGSACRNTSEGWGRFGPGDNARFLEYARASICEVQDCLTEARQKKYIDEKLYDRLWILTRRALGTNTNYMKYLKWCARTGAKPWLKEGAAKNPKPKNPRTKNPGTENS
jgi:four helix bundle protein